MTPALYYLTPSFAGGLEIADPSLPSTLFDPDLWQPSIFDTIAEYIRLHGAESMNQTKRREMAREIFAAMLKAATTHRQRIDKLDVTQAGLRAHDWLCVVGVDSETRVRLQIVKSGQSPEFAFRSGDRTNLWSETGDAVRRLTGDGTVPFEGAIPKFLPYESLVCVRPNDFGYWEIADKAALKLAGFHGILPNMDMLHRLIVRFFTGRADTHENTWGFPPPGISTQDWTPPLELSVGT